MLVFLFGADPPASRCEALRAGFTEFTAFLDRIYPSTIFRSYGTGRIDWILLLFSFILSGLRPGSLRAGSGPGGKKW